MFSHISYVITTIFLATVWVTRKIKTVMRIKNKFFIIFSLQSVAPIFSTTSIVPPNLSCGE